jgi:hypothetical protein
MKLKALFSRIANARLTHEARVARRALRDLQRHETSRINALEKRARGLRLYVAWSRKPVSSNWSPRTTITAPAFVKPLEAAALA